jgi:hypothetical protein
MFGFFNSMIQEKNLKPAIKRMHQEKSTELYGYLAAQALAQRVAVKKSQKKINIYFLTI